MDSIAKQLLLKDVYKLLGINKAATWSWETVANINLNINKNMPAEDAKQLYELIRHYVDTHSDFSRPDVFGRVHNLFIFDSWGDSDV